MTQQPAQVHPLALIPRLLVVVALCGAWSAAQAQSLFFTSNFTPNDAGRVEIQVDGRPIDVGAGEFTLEFWMRASSGNSRGGVNCNTSDYSWINGNIVFDRDRTDTGARDFGLAIANGRIAFGVENSNGSYTICSGSTVLNDEWRHIAVQRRASDGRLWVHVDGVLEQEAVGPVGDISYPNGQNVGTLQPLLTIGREKYGFDYGYTGWLDEIRISNVLRHQSNNFQVPTTPYDFNTSTVALYHLDENGGDDITDENSNESPGIRLFSTAAGPNWSTETPFSATPGPGTLRFSANTYTAPESTANRVITVRRVGGSAGAASVDWAVTGGTGTLTADYQLPPPPGRLTWADGQSDPRTFPITIVNDTAVEGNETINLALSNATGASLGTPSSAVVTIADNDSPPTSAGTLQFTAAAFTVAENTTTLGVTVSRSGGTMGAATVNVDLNGGNATLNSDFAVSTTPLSWADGEQGNRTFTITLMNDTLAEGSEAIELVLADATGATIGTQSSATVTITDDDQAANPPPPTPPNPPTQSSSGGGGASGLLWPFVLAVAAAWRRRRSTRS